ncbi:MAG: serine dehydratase subunit alpha family protein, partial [Porphyromonas sp.]|nr:serine dehydratase subunit alpha family protein [Porphyromonas sp.]
MTQNDYQRINALIRREVVPATGCTEPAAVALCVAYAASLVEETDELQRIEVLLS